MLVRWAIGALLPSFAVSSLPAGSACLPCHRAEVSGYQQSAMARSLSHSAQQPSGTFKHSLSASTLEVKTTGGVTQIGLSRGGISISYPVAYVIGSGTHASGEIVRIGDYLFQAPISYYPGRREWDMAPGYESSAEPDFTRPVSAECLECHSGRPRPVASTLNRYEPLPASNEAINCDRCHGDASAHLLRPNRINIVNPSRLPIRARDSVCEQCHLAGEVRVLNPGKQFSDFQAGHNLEETFSVYVRDRSGAAAEKGSIKVISHVEQLQQSACARNSSGKLWCATCHNPHSQPTSPAQYFRDRCLTCHGQALLQTHAKPVDDCVSCHMPKRRAKDGGHSVFTDHFIARVPQPDTLSPTPVPPVEKLVAWHEPAGGLAQRNLGLANIELGLLQHSEALLAQGAQQAVAAMKFLPEDPWILTKLGLVLMQTGEASDAIEPLEYAARLEPNRAGSRVNLANAYKEAGQTGKAIGELERAIALDPSLESAYETLGAIYVREKNFASALRTFQLYLKFMPNNILARKLSAEYSAAKK